MSATPVYAKVVEKLISVLTGTSDVSNVVSTRVYGSHLSTIIDPRFPAISMQMVDGSRFVDQAGIETFIVQMDLWMSAKGAQPAVWDDVMQLAADVGEALHGNSFVAAAVRLLKVSSAGQGAQMYEEEKGLLHLPLRFKIMAVAL